jgi:hypothetical protein
MDIPEAHPVSHFVRRPPMLNMQWDAEQPEFTADEPAVDLRSYLTTL